MVCLAFHVQTTLLFCPACILMPVLPVRDACTACVLMPVLPVRDACTARILACTACILMPVLEACTAGILMHVPSLSFMPVLPVSLCLYCLNPDAVTPNKPYPWLRKRRHQPDEGSGYRVTIPVYVTEHTNLPKG